MEARKTEKKGYGKIFLIIWDKVWGGGGGGEESACVDFELDNKYFNVKAKATKLGDFF